MANQIQLFENPTFGSVRVLTINNEPWFVAVDVCKCLDLTNPTEVLRNLDEDERHVVKSQNYSVLSNTEDAWILDIPGFENNPKGCNVVSEAGLYSLIFRSRKSEAKYFKRWVTHEVLPSIRKTGMFVPDSSAPVEEALPPRTNFVLPKDYLSALKSLVASEQELIKLRFDLAKNYLSDLKALVASEEARHQVPVPSKAEIEAFYRSIYRK